MTGRTERAGEPVDLGRIALALRRGRLWIVAAGLLGLPAAFALTTWVTPARFVARTAMVWELAVPVQSEAEGARQLRTMVDGIALPQNLMEIRERQGLDDDLAAIAARLSVDYDRDSNLVTIGATDRSPRRAAVMANTAASVFVEQRRRFEADRRRELVHAVDDDLSRARAELAAVRAEYGAFRRANGIADLSTETTRAIEATASLRAQADLAQGDVAAEQSRARSQRLQARRVASPRANQPVPLEVSAEERAIAARLAQARLELVEAKSRFSDAHPDVQRLEFTIAALRQQQRVAPAALAPVGAPAMPRLSAPTTSSRSEAAQERQRTFVKLAADSQQRLQQLSQQQGEAARLLAAQGFAETHLAELTALRSRVVDEARSPVTGLRILSTAVPPERPESSVSQPFLFLLMPLGFAALATIVLLGRQLYALRVHTAREVAYWGRGVAVASTVWPKGGETLETLLDEIADGAAAAEGSTLIVAATPADAYLARGLAAHLSAAAAPAPPSESEGHMAEIVLVPPAPDHHATIPIGLPSPDPSTQGSHDAGRPFSARTSFSAGGSPAHGTLAVRVVETQSVRGRAAWRAPTPTFTAWMGPLSGATLRRLGRLADRVLVLVRSGSTSIRELAEVRASIGREEGVGFVLLDLDKNLHGLPDRAGLVDEYWRGKKG